MQLLGWITRATVPARAALQAAILLGVGIWSVARHRAASAATQMQLRGYEPLPAYIFVAAAALLSSCLAFAANVFTRLPTGSDAVTYHLPLALRWLQAGSLTIPASRAWRYGMPGNAEIGMMILLSSGKQSLAVVSSWIPALMLTLSIYLLAMWIGKENRLASITICLIVLSIPMIEWQIFSAYVDLLGTAGILAVFALLLSTSHGKPGDNFAVFPSALCFVSGLACGISVGTKPIYYFFATVFSVFMVWVFWANRKWAAKTLLKLAMLVVVGLLLPSLFWFARGLKQTGNPVYPMQVKIGQRVIFAGYGPSDLGSYQDFEFAFVQRKREWLAYPWTEWKRFPGFLKVPYGEGEGVGSVFATFVPLGVLFFFFRAWVLRPVSCRDWILLLVFAGIVVSWWTVMQRVLRYGQAILMFACILSVPLAVLLQSRKRRAFAALLVASTIATSMVSASVPLHMLTGRIRKHMWSRSQIYAYPKLIDDLPAGSIVLNASGIEEKNFPLAGKELTNRVIASFEAPPELTPESLHASGADYLVEVVPGQYSEYSLSSSGATVMDDELVPTGKDQIRWRISKVGEGNGNLPR